MFVTCPSAPCALTCRRRCGRPGTGPQRKATAMSGMVWYGKRLTDCCCLALDAARVSGCASLPSLRAPCAGNERLNKNNHQISLQIQNITKASLLPYKDIEILTAIVYSIVKYPIKHNHPKLGNYSDKHSAHTLQARLMVDVAAAESKESH